MTTTSLYAEFSAAIRSLPEADLLDTIERTEHAVTHACRASADAVFVPVGTIGHPVDQILDIFKGHTVGVIADTWAKLRNELADDVARCGADADIVQELRDGGPRPTSIVAGR